uniref:Uncharacterized protein n=1 Tax=Quercus lobata TaxID=97700 RepID=A0A7N2R1P5_QUELO
MPRVIPEVEEANAVPRRPYPRTNPIPGELNKLVSFELDALTYITFGVQLNVFKCGAIGIGACISHKIADALSFIVFLKTWATTTYGDDDIESPEFDAATLFPPKDWLDMSLIPPSGDGIEAYVSLKKEEMDKFESEEEFLTFVSLPGIQLKN